MIGTKKRYEIRKISNHPYANCRVVLNGDDTILYSYQTAVVQIKKLFGKRYIMCTGTYSATTRKHIGYFLKEYAPDLCYYDMKNIVGKKKFTIM